MGFAARGSGALSHRHGPRSSGAGIGDAFIFGAAFRSPAADRVCRVVVGGSDAVLSRGYVNRNGRHRHTYYIIANSEILGYTPQQRRIIAAIARYLGKSRPAPGDAVMKNLVP